MCLGHPLPVRGAWSCSSNVSAVDLLSFHEFLSLLHRVAARMPEDGASRWDRPVMCPLSLVKRLFRHLDYSSGLRTLLRSSRAPMVSAGRLRKYVPQAAMCGRLCASAASVGGVSHILCLLFWLCGYWPAVHCFRGFVTQNGSK